MRHTNILLISLVLSAACTSARPLGTAGARRRLSQVSAAAGTLGGSATAGDNGGVFTDGKYIKGVPILRTTGYSRFDRSTGNLLNADANQAAAREGITNFLVDSQTAYTAARMDRNTRGQLTSEYTQSAIRGGSAAQGAAAGSGVTNLWSNAAGALKMGSNTRRAELAGDRTAAAIRASLDNPNDAFRATATGAVQANSVAWSQNYNGWSR